MEELRNGYWRPRQFHLSPAIFPFLSPPSLPFSLPRYFFTDPSFLFFLLLSPAIFLLLLSPLIFSRPFVCHCNSSISSNKTKVSIHWADTSSIQRMKIPPPSKSKHFSQNRTFIQRLFFKTSTYSTLVHCSKLGQYVVWLKKFYSCNLQSLSFQQTEMLRLFWRALFPPPSQIKQLIERP